MKKEWLWENIHTKGGICALLTSFDKNSLKFIRGWINVLLKDK